MCKAGVRAVIDLAGLALSFPFMDLLPELSRRHKTSVLHFLRELVEMGGLMSYGPT